MNSVRVLLATILVFLCLVHPVYAKSDNTYNEFSVMSESKNQMTDEQIESQFKLLLNDTQSDEDLWEEKFPKEKFLERLKKFDIQIIKKTNQDGIMAYKKSDKEGHGSLIGILYLYSGNEQERLHWNG
jgi:hypothetical protein